MTDYRIKLGYAYGGMLYAPLFVAHQRNLLPRFVELVPCEHDVDAHNKVRAGTVDFALCDPFAEADDPNESVLVADFLIGTVPLWILTTTGFSKPNATALFEKLHDEATRRADQNHGVRMQWMCLPSRTTAYQLCFQRKKPFLAHSNIKVLEEERSDSINPTPWKAADQADEFDGLDVCFSADAYEVATVRDTRLSKASVGCALGRDPKCSNWLFTGLIGRSDLQSRTAELVGIWAGIWAARRALTSKIPAERNDAYDAAFSWFSEAHPSLDRERFDRGLDLLRGEGKFAINCWDVATERENAYRSAIQIWNSSHPEKRSLLERFRRNGSSGAEHGRTQTQAMQLFFGPTHAIAQVEQSELTGGDVGWAHAPPSEPNSMYLTARASIGAVVVLLVTVVLTVLGFHMSAVWLCGLLGSATVAFASTRAVKALRALANRRVVRPWLAAEIAFWLSLVALLSATFLELYDHRPRAGPSVSQASVAKSRAHVTELPGSHPHQ
ncbi:MAG TPA: hypothetical protein VJU82_07935 [Acidobacteriaceae bacterium]|nr:hypothetical protein [Acidobacteriaceae bacterium]